MNRKEKISLVAISTGGLPFQTLEPCVFHVKGNSLCRKILSWWDYVPCLEGSAGPSLTRPVRVYIDLFDICACMLNWTDCQITGIACHGSFIFSAFAQKNAHDSQRNRFRCGQKKTQFTRRAAFIVDSVDHVTFFWGAPVDFVSNRPYRQWSGGRHKQNFLPRFRDLSQATAPGQR